MEEIQVLVVIFKLTLARLLNSGGHHIHRLINDVGFHVFGLLTRDGLGPRDPLLDVGAVGPLKVLGLLNL